MSRLIPSRQTGDIVTRLVIKATLHSYVKFIHGRAALFGQDNPGLPYPINLVQSDSIARILQDLLAHDGVRPVSCVVDQTLPGGGADSTLTILFGRRTPFHSLSDFMPAFFVFLSSYKQSKYVFHSPLGARLDPSATALPAMMCSPPVPNPNTTLGQKPSAEKAMAVFPLALD